jgi:hypothetical protein
MANRTIRLLQKIASSTRLTVASLSNEVSFLRNEGLSAREIEAELRDKYLDGPRAIHYRS